MKSLLAFFLFLFSISLYCQELDSIFNEKIPEWESQSLDSGSLERVSIPVRPKKRIARPIIDEKAATQDGSLGRLIPVSNNGLKGIINSEGRVIIPSEYKEITYLRSYEALGQYLFLVKTIADRYNIIDLGQKSVLENDVSMLVRASFDTFISIDTINDTNELVTIQGLPATDVTVYSYDNIKRRTFKSHKYGELIEIGNGRFNGFIDADGKIVLPLLEQQVIMGASRIVVNPLRRNRPSRVYDFDLNELYSTSQHSIQMANEEVITIREHGVRESKIIDYDGGTLMTSIVIKEARGDYQIYTEAESGLYGVLTGDGYPISLPDLLYINTTLNKKILILTDTLGLSTLFNPKSREIIVPWGDRQYELVTADEALFKKQEFLVTDENGVLQVYNASGKSLLPKNVKAYLRPKPFSSIIAYQRRGEWKLYDLVKQEHVTESSFLTVGSNASVWWRYRKWFTRKQLTEQVFYAFNKNGEFCIVLRDGSIVTKNE